MKKYIAECEAKLAAVQTAIENVGQFAVGQHTVSMLTEEWFAICDAVGKPQMSSKSEPEFLLAGASFKFNFNLQGNVTCFRGYERQLQGQWVALVDATNGKHLSTTQQEASGELSAAEKNAERYRVFVAGLVASINQEPLTPVQQAMLDAFSLQEGTATVDEVTAVIDAAMAIEQVKP